MNQIPLPGAIDGRKWKIRPGRGSVELESGQLNVPYGNSPHDQFVRLHELGHAKWTPRIPPGKAAKKYGVPVDWLQVAEDRRITALLDLANGISGGTGWFGTLSGPIEDSDIPEMVAILGIAGDPKTHRSERLAILRKFCQGLLASHGTRSYDRMSSVLKKIRTERGMKIVWSGLTNARMFIESTLHALRVEDHRPLDKSEFSELTFENVTVPLARALGGIFEDNDDDEEPIRGDASAEMSGELAKETARAFDGHKLGGFLRPGGPAKWGEVTILRPILTEKSRAPRLNDSPKNRSVDEGSVPLHMHRLCTDGRIFRARTKKPGGVILLDASGSMEFTCQQIHQIAHESPGSMVACYAGRGESMGYIVVLSDKGRCISEVELKKIRGQIGVNNLIDAPAIRWAIGLRRGKVYWLTDQYVTDQDGPTLSGLEECLTLCRTHGVRIYGSLASLLENRGIGR